MPQGDDYGDPTGYLKDEPEEPAPVEGLIVIDPETGDRYQFRRDESGGLIAVNVDWQPTTGSATTGGIPNIRMTRPPQKSVGGLWISLDYQDTLQVGADGKILRKGKAEDFFTAGPAPAGPSYESILQMYYNMRRDYWDQQVQAGRLPRLEAIEQFEADMSEFTARLQAQTEQRLAETANQTAAINVEDIATQRGRSWAQDILPVALPGMTQLRVPGLEQVFPGGNMPLPQVPANPAAYYGQFRPTVPQVAMPGLGAGVPPAPRLAPTQVPPVPMPGI